MFVTAFSILLNLRCGKLAVVECAVKSALFKQFLVIALLNDIAVLHNKNKVGFFNC